MFTYPLTKQEVDVLEASGQPVPPDWAASLTLANVAVRKLEDALPRADKSASVAAVAELEAAVNGIKSFLVLRGVTV